MREIKMTVYVKEGKKYNASRYCIDREAVYAALASDLINKKILKASYISRIVRFSNYDGTQTVKVFYDNGVMCEYIVESHI
jgi:hypothetical protein